MSRAKSRITPRRTFLKRGAWLSAATLAAAAGGSRTALAQFKQAFGPIDRGAVTAGDIAMLKFLAAAELVEDDLWQQYCKLAVGNRSYNRALEVTLGDQTMTATAGVLALLPRGIPHGFTNIGETPSRVLDTILPGAFDGYFVEAAALYADGEPEPEQVDALSRKYAIRYL